MIRFEDAILARTETRRDRKLVVFGQDDLTKYIYADTQKMGLRSELVQSFEDGRWREYTPEKNFILVPVFKEHKKYYDFLCLRGYKYNIDFALMNFGGYTRGITAIDPLLGYTRDTHPIPQYDVIGSGKCKIGVFGGSTTELGKGGKKCWPLYTSGNKHIGKAVGKLLERCIKTR